MINNYKNAKSRKVHETGNPRGFKGLDGELAADRMDDLDAALDINDLSPLKSVNLHILKGSRKRQYAVNANGPWRVVFTLTEDGFEDVEIINYHKG
ncbi:MAG: type II toxin-antitoxin system RelE/ParE family toxin [Rhodospirillales bacterium]|jgi:proteic killer suppression protein|nr:type II toxin-antitoxin system RelE/ParE family toxin [Rhodospirillales bacterium]